MTGEGWCERASVARQLVNRRANVWIDQWEPHVGDSLTQKIQGAIEGASALLVILSKASVESEWWKKELSSGLIRDDAGWLRRRIRASRY